MQLFLRSAREHSHGHVLGPAACHQHPALRAARRFRSRRRHAVRLDAQRNRTTRHDHGRGAHLGRQRDLAGRDRGHSVGGFPVAYSILLSAFYLPLLVMLAGLILRGVAFEYRYKTTRMRWLWNWSFVGGSFAASFSQGLTVGALVEGLPIANGQYAGGEFGWFSPFAALCGIGLCLGYALLGACWLVKKCDTEVRDRAHRQIRVLAVSVLVFLVVVFVYALAEHLPILHRWIDRPYLFAFPAIGAVAAIVLTLSILRQNDRWPFPMGVVIFLP